MLSIRCNSSVILRRNQKKKNNNERKENKNPQRKIKIKPFMNKYS